MSAHLQENERLDENTVLKFEKKNENMSWKLFLTDDRANVTSPWTLKYIEPINRKFSMEFANFVFVEFHNLPRSNL